MRIVFLDQQVHQLGRVAGEVHGAKIFSKFKMSVDLMPLTQRAQLAFWCVREDGIAEIQQVDTAIKFARAHLRPSMRALGDQLYASMLARKQRENLRRLAVFHFAQTDAS